MKILAFTTSTDHGSVALMAHGKVLGQTRWSRKPLQSEALILKIQDLLKRTELKPHDLSAIAVDKGPGSFTGCRIAVNAAKTFAYTLDVPIIAVTSLDALAYERAGLVLCVMDAHKSLLYSRLYEGGYPLQKTVEARPLDQLVSLVNEKTLVCGSCPKEFQEAFKERGAKVLISYPEAKTIGFFAEKFLTQAQGATQTWRDVEPSYVRAPDAVEKLYSR